MTPAIAPIAARASGRPAPAASVWTFRIACNLCIITALMHAAAQHFAPIQPANPAQQQVLELMSSAQFDLPGARRTMHNLMDGFGWHFGLSLIALAALGIAFGWKRTADPTQRRTFAGIAALATLAMTLNSLFLFFAVPTTCFALITLFFTASWATSRQLRSPSP